MAATSTHHGDESKLKSIILVLGIRINLNIGGTKSMTGHLLGAAGAFEAIISIKAFTDHIAPPKINANEVEPAWKDKFNLTLGMAQPKELNYAMSNTFGFGGHIATTIFKKYVRQELCNQIK